MLYKTKPKGLETYVKVVGCYMEINGEILLLQRNYEKLNGDKWGLPAGKVDVGESEEEAVVREIFEETGINLKNVLLENSKCILENGNYILQKVESFYGKHENLNFHWTAFSVKFSEKPKVKIENKEHKNFVWIKPERAILELDLIDDQKELLEIRIAKYKVDDKSL
jgi:8-oxo-dGTP pyrophosphatase MutT (NUDIX family)